MRLIPDPPGKIVNGEVWFNNENLLLKSNEEMQKIRGKDISMIFQEPMTALNPTYTIADQIAEVILLHEMPKNNEKKFLDKLNFIKKRYQQKKIKKIVEEKVIDVLKMVKIPNPETVAKQYPHELSGGMRQRVMIAMMLACNPKLLIADEPTTALDVTIQAQILELVKDLQKNTNASIWLITHDLGIIAEMCNNVGVMYAGYITEFGDTKTIFKWPYHPYTQGLMKAIPKITEKREKLDIIPGSVPNLISPPSGCRFHPRCNYATDICKKAPPPLNEVEPGHFVACYRYEDVKYALIPNNKKEEKRNE
jgi:oligopeptide/dipeptide ABC transporter ATP-binding protein